MFLLVSLAACWYMTGLVWFVQLVAYPQFGRVAVAEFAAYHRAHSTFTGVVVLPPMLVELAAGVGLVWQAPHDPLYVTALVLLGVVWANTFGMAVPTHGRLARGHDAALIAWLVRLNWVRTVAWTARGVLLAVAVGRRMAAGSQ